MKEEMMVIKRLYEKISNETDYYKYASIEVKNIESYKIKKNIEKLNI
jgi:hypothetical protein